jgi:hypothetical protein
MSNGDTRGVRLQIMLTGEELRQFAVQCADAEPRGCSPRAFKARPHSRRVRSSSLRRQIRRIRRQREDAARAQNPIVTVRSWPLADPNRAGCSRSAYSQLTAVIAAAPLC